MNAALQLRPARGQRFPEVGHDQLKSMLSALVEDRGNHADRGVVGMKQAVINELLEGTSDQPYRPRRHRMGLSRSS